MILHRFHFTKEKKRLKFFFIEISYVHMSVHTWWHSIEHARDQLIQYCFSSFFLCIFDCDPSTCRHATLTPNSVAQSVNFSCKKKKNIYFGVYAIAWALWRLASRHLPPLMCRKNWFIITIVLWHESYRIVSLFTGSRRKLGKKEKCLRVNWRILWLLLFIESSFETFISSFGLTLFGCSFSHNCLLPAVDIWSCALIARPSHHFAC